MKKRTLKFRTTEIDGQPFKPLLKGSESISNVNLRGFREEFTKELLKKHLDFLIPDPVREVSEYFHGNSHSFDRSDARPQKQRIGRREY